LAKEAVNEHELEPRNPPTRVPASLNGFALWNTILRLGPTAPHGLAVDSRGDLYVD
jgi:hypothetical protein